MRIAYDLKKLTLFSQDKQNMLSDQKISFLLLTLVNMKIITFGIEGILLQKSNDIVVFT